MTNEMLDSISRLGNFVEARNFLGEPIKATNVLSIQFMKKKKMLCYKGIELEEKKEEKRYLYRRDKSGKPGLFLSWRISSTDVRKVKKAITEKNVETIRDFEDKKIKWLAYKDNEWFESKLKILRDFPPAKENKWLRQILNAYAENLNKICRDLKRKIDTAVEESLELLITIKIIDDGKEYYPGDYGELAKLFEEYVGSVKA